MISQMASKSIKLSLASLADAKFIVSLRKNSQLNKYISTFTGDIEEQRIWLEKYKVKEREGNEFYYIISRADNGLPIGTVRLYDFNSEVNSFCWGSWILNGNKTTTAALESALLVYKIGFEYLNFENSHFQVNKDNVSVIDFHKKTGALILDENDDNVNFKYTPLIYSKFKLRYSKFLLSNY